MFVANVPVAAFSKTILSQRPNLCRHAQPFLSSTAPQIRFLGAALRPCFSKSSNQWRTNTRWSSGAGVSVGVVAESKQYDSFEEMLKSSSTPILVDFYANWCGPCQLLIPVLEQLNEVFEGRWKVVKLDTDAYPEVASQYRVRALPTIVLFKDGKEVDRIEGLAPFDVLLEHFNPLL